MAASQLHCMESCKVRSPLQPSQGCRTEQQMSALLQRPESRAATSHWSTGDGPCQ